LVAARRHPSMVYRDRLKRRLPLCLFARLTGLGLSRWHVRQSLCSARLIIVVDARIVDILGSGLSAFDALSLFPELMGRNINLMAR
jgi:hypothetical protein